MSRRTRVVLLVQALLMLTAQATYAIGALVDDRVPVQTPQRVILADVEVEIRDLVAITRLRQTFANSGDDAISATYEAMIPAGAIITDMATRTEQGRPAHRFVWDWLGRGAEDRLGILRRSTPLSGPPRREQVELPLRGITHEIVMEYVERLRARGSQLVYRLPMTAGQQGHPVLIDSLSMVVTVHANPAFDVSVAAPYGALSSRTVDPDGTLRIPIVGKDLSQAADVELVLTDLGDRPPRLQSWTDPADDQPGYYALWLPVTSDLGPSVRPAVSILVHLSDEIGAAARAAVSTSLATIVQGLPEDTPLDVVVPQGQLQPSAGLATPERKARAVALLEEADLVSSEPGVDEALRHALMAAIERQALDRPHSLLLVHNDVDQILDPAEERGPADARRQLLELIAADGGQMRASVLTVSGADRRRFSGAEARRFGDLLATAFSGDDMRATDAPEIYRRLAAMGADLATPRIHVGRIHLQGARLTDVQPEIGGWHPAGASILQTGRYFGSGEVQLTVGDREIPTRGLTLAMPSPEEEVTPNSGRILLYEDYADSVADGWTTKDAQSVNYLRWNEQIVHGGIYRLTGVLARTFVRVDARSYTIEARLRPIVPEGNLIPMQADPDGLGAPWSLDMGDRDTELKLPGRVLQQPSHAQEYAFRRHLWHDIRVEIGDGAVSVWIDDEASYFGLLHGAVPDGVIGFGVTGTHYNDRPWSQIEVDHILIREGTSHTPRRVGALLDGSSDPARVTSVLWAIECVDGLERQILGDIRPQIRELGLRYDLQTSQTGIGIALPNEWPDPTSAGDDGETMPPQGNRGAAQLGPNSPNPFPAATTIPYLLPEGTDSPASLSIYNAVGQRLRRIPLAAQPGRYVAQWDGRDAAGRPVASGTYLYRLEAGGHEVTRTMVLLRR